MSIGRIDDMVKVKGANIWPDAVHHAVMSVTDVAEYQVEIRRRPDGGEQLALIVEPARNPDEDLRRRIEHQVRAATYVRPVVEFRTGLPRHDYQARRWSDLRDSPGPSWKAQEVEAS
jgi:phenylacetate-CoA ligase